MANLNDLANRMRELPGILASESSRCAVEATTVVHHQLTHVTPVDTSQALSNWDISIGTLNGEFHEPYFPGNKGSTKLASEKAANTEAVFRLKEKKPGQAIFISNGANYIDRLNNGSSKQEPAGFVERASSVGKQSIKKFKMKLR